MHDDIQFCSILVECFAWFFKKTSVFLNIIAIFCILILERSLCLYLHRHPAVFERHYDWRIVNALDIM